MSASSPNPKQLPFLKNFLEEHKKNYRTYCKEKWQVYDSTFKAQQRLLREIPGLLRQCFSSSPNLSKIEFVHGRKDILLQCPWLSNRSWFLPPLRGEQLSDKGRHAIIRAIMTRASIAGRCWKIWGIRGDPARYGRSDANDLLRYVTFV